MNMRKMMAYSLIIISLFFSTLAIAQSAARYDEKVKKMTDFLNLSSDQQAKYKTLLISSEKEKDELTVKLKTVSPEEKKKLQNQYKNNYENQLKKILTAAQFKKLSEGAKAKKK